MAYTGIRYKHETKVVGCTNEPRLAILVGPQMAVSAGLQQSNYCYNYLSQLYYTIDFQFFTIFKTQKMDGDIFDTHLR